MAATLPVRALFRCVLIFAGQIMSALLHAATSMYRNGPAMIAMKPWRDFWPEALEAV